jgi:hypothetical protein
MGNGMVQEVAVTAYDDGELLDLEKEFDAAYAVWEAAFEAAGFGSSQATEAADAVLNEIVDRLLGARAKSAAGLRVKFKVWRLWIGGGAEWHDGSEASAIMQSLWSDVTEMVEPGASSAQAHRSPADALIGRSTN